MKRNLIAVAVVAALFSAPVFATEHTGWVYNGNTGWGHVDEDQFNDTSFSSSTNIGYRWGIVGVEVGYAWIGDFQDDVTVANTKIKTELEVSGWTAGINLNGDISDKWSMQGRIGAFAWDADAKLAVGNTQVKFSDDQTDWYAGVTVTYTWSKRYSIGLGYTYLDVGGDAIDAGIHLVGVASEYRF